MIAAVQGLTPLLGTGAACFKPATLVKVQQAVAQLGYVRNGAAQALASRRTQTVAKIYPTLSNPIFSVSIHKLQQTLWKYGYQLLVSSHEYEPQREIDLLRVIVERGVDAVVLVGTDHSHEVYEMARQYALPYVLTWSIDDSTYPHCVGFGESTVKGHRLIAWRSRCSASSTVALGQSRLMRMKPCPSWPNFLPLSSQTPASVSRK